jgi:hypothetical protein
VLPSWLLVVACRCVVAGIVVDRRCSVSWYQLQPLPLLVARCSLPSLCYPIRSARVAGIVVVSWLCYPIPATATVAVLLVARCQLQPLPCCVSWLLVAGIVVDRRGSIRNGCRCSVSLLVVSCNRCRVAVVVA